VPRGAIWYGVELEVETTSSDVSDAAYDCRRAIGEGFVITKHDGSLGAGGFELVSIPAPLERHKRQWDSFLSNPPRGLRSWETQNRCGMHVNVSRKPLSQLAIGKILVFINADENRSFVERVAGRPSCFYSDYRKKTITDARRYTEHREAVNLSNRERVEIRIFRGTLKKSSFMKNLEFVHAMVRFCRFTGINHLDVYSFLDWFKGTRKDYPYLDQWLVSKGYITPRSKPIKNRSK
jgi:hypothetical protein